MMRGHPRRRGGFSYVGVLLLVAVTGVTLAAAGTLWSTAAQREREVELLFVGDEYRRAIGSYYEASPGAKQYPRRLDELLRDTRLPTTRRHLRRLYADPMTGKADWGLVLRGDQIVGVYSKSERAPIKRNGFASPEAGFETAAAYADWRFVYAPTGGTGRGGAPVGTVTGLATASFAPAATVPSAVGAVPLVAVPPRAEPAPAPARAGPRLVAQLPREPWVCAAQRANDLRACDLAPPDPSAAGVQLCKRAAQSRYGSCMGGATAGPAAIGE